MTKTELLAAVQAKTGFIAIVSDNKTLDSAVSVAAPKEKRYLVVEHQNTDGTRGSYNVYYILDTSTQNAWYYNTEPVAFDTQHKDVPQQTLDALKAYCKANFAAYFLIPDRIDAENKWAVVEAYVLGGTPAKLTKSLKMVYKTGTNPIAHIDII